MGDLPKRRPAFTNCPNIPFRNSRSCTGFRLRADNRQPIESCNDAVALACGGLQRLAISDCDLAATVFDSPALLQLLRKQGYRCSPESEHLRYLLLRQQ